MKQLMFHHDPAFRFETPGNLGPAAQIEQQGAAAHRHPGTHRPTVARIFDWLDDTIRPGARHAARRTP
ncbi:hypothetical protein [Kitasatospora sp. NPDC050543]|uniref:hypothetical protein n=1 Tax=Kitasatospora sp. NPDC050543 TaxID=3364054 RepID=UPI003787F140